MKKTRISLYRGVEMTALTTDKFKFNTLSLSFIMPLTRENASYAGLAARVLNRGCAAYPTLRDISLQCDRLYSASVSAGCRKSGESLMLNFTLSTLDNSYAYDGTDVFGEALELMGEIIYNPLVSDGAFKEEYVESEKKNMIDDIRAQINNKSTYALNRCIELMCDGEAFAVYGGGDEATVSGTDAKSLYEKYAEMISSLPAVVCFIGNVAPEQVAEKLKKVLKLTDRDTKLPETRVIRTAGPVKEITEEMEINQGKLSIGFRTGCCMTDEDYPAFPLFGTLFGTSPTSKLFLNVREKLSLCYYCSPVSDALKGTMVVASGIDCANKEKAQAAILHELEDIKKGNFTDEEFENAVRSIRNSYMEAMDSPNALANWFSVRLLAGIDDTPEEYIEKLMSYGRDDIIRAANRVTLDTVYFLKGRAGE